jgi:hypothetical protein
MTNIIPFGSRNPKLFERCVLDELTVPLGFKWGSLALHFAGYRKIGDIVRAQPEDLLKVPHIGKRKLELIHQYFATNGIVYPRFHIEGAKVVPFPM